MRKSAALEAKAGAYHHGLAPNERALSLARQPSEAEWANSNPRDVVRARGERA